MLGAVKDEGSDAEVPLFRLLARRWKSFAPVQHERTTLLSRKSKEEAPKQARAWISKARAPVYAHQKIERPNEKRAWNPWLWVK